MFISGNGRVVHKIRHHEEDIHDIAWAPPGSARVFRGDDDDEADGKSDGDEDNNNGGALFAASGRDRQVSVWCGKSGRQVANLRLTHNPQKKPSNADKNFQFWMAALWDTPETLLTGGPYAEMLR